MGNKSDKKDCEKTKADFQGRQAWKRFKNERAASEKAAAEKRKKKDKKKDKK